MLLLWMTYQLLSFVLRPEAVMKEAAAGAATTRIEQLSNQAEARWPKMKSVAPEIRVEA